MKKRRLPEGSWHVVLLWPALCALLAVLMWGLLQYKLDSDRAQLEANALRDASSLAKTYAEYTAQTLRQLDQLTLHVKYDWELSRGALRLQDLSDRGLFPPESAVYVSISDAFGMVRTTSMPLDRPLDLSSREAFRFHRDNRSENLYISAPILGRISHRTVIHTARRLSGPDGAFDGIVLASVEPKHMLTFYEKSIFGSRGFLAVVGNDGKLRASSIGGPASPPADPALSSIPRFESPAGASFLPGTPWFADGDARYVGWQPVKGYPLYVMAGVSQREALAPHDVTRRSYTEFALAGSVFFLLSAMMGIVLSTRLAWRKQQAEEIRAAYRIATEGGNEGFYRVRALYNSKQRIIDFVVEDCNERGAEMVGTTKSRFLGIRFTRFFSSAIMEKVLADFRNGMETGYQEDEFLVGPHSPIRGGWVHRKMVRTGAGLAVTLRDITEVKAHEQALSRLVNEDTLTKLPNRHWLVNYLPSALERAQANRRMVGLLFVDLDDFKNINDTMGHSAGDELLRAVALRLKSLLRPGDSVARLGGDEFTVVIENVSSESDVASVAARIVETFGEPWQLPGARNVLSASIGISIFPRDGQDIDTLLKNADIAMYSAKSAGKGQYRTFEPELFNRLKQRLDTRQALQHAIENDEFVLHYQPRVDASTGALCSMEALVRWNHPERGMVAPLEFIALAEETGLILQLGALVMDKACAQLAQWQMRKLAPTPVSVNVSARQFNDGSVRDLVASCLERYDLPASLLEIELTESAMMGENTELLTELSAIRELGIKLLVDDFGTGYSSLSQLQRLDMDVLKVDRAFTAELGKTREGEVFFLAIVSMAHALGMRVVAEGVETREQMHMLQKLRCDEIQGYFISRPLSDIQAAILLRERLALHTGKIMPVAG